MQGHWKTYTDKYKYPTAEGMVESALKHIAILEDLNFTDIVISLKASDVRLTIDAYKLMAEKVNYPFIWELQQRVQYGPAQ